MNIKKFRVISFPLVVYLIWYLIILIYQLLLQPIYGISQYSQTIYQRLFFSWINYWDSAHYISISQNGYVIPQQAFFPLWPLLIKLTTFVLKDPYFATFILSFILGLSTFILLFLLAQKLIGRYAKVALILFACFPSTMFLHAGYTEGLFLSLILFGCLLLEGKKYVLAATLIGLATATRFAGVAAALVFLFIGRSKREKLFYILIALSGLIGYIIYSYFNFGDGLLFIHGQQAWCQSQGRCSFYFPLVSIFAYLKSLFIGNVKPGLSVTFFDWFFASIFLLLLIAVFKKLLK